MIASDPNAARSSSRWMPPPPLRPVLCPIIGGDKAANWDHDFATDSLNDSNQPSDATVVHFASAVTTTAADARWRVSEGTGAASAKSMTRATRLAPIQPRHPPVPHVHSGSIPERIGGCKIIRSLVGGAMEQYLAKQLP
jgi:hypothetical protein